MEDLIGGILEVVCEPVFSIIKMAAKTAVTRHVGCFVAFAVFVLFFWVGLGCLIGYAVSQSTLGLLLGGGIGVALGLFSVLRLARSRGTQQFSNRPF